MCLPRGKRPLSRAGHAGWGRGAGASVFLITLWSIFTNDAAVWYVSAAEMPGRRHQYVLALYTLLTGIILKGLTLQTCVFDICVYRIFYVCIGIDLRKGLYIIMRRVLNCALDRVW